MRLEEPPRLEAWVEEQQPLLLVPMSVPLVVVLPLVLALPLSHSPQLKRSEVRMCVSASAASSEVQGNQPRPLFRGLLRAHGPYHHLALCPCLLRHDRCFAACPRVHWRLRDLRGDGASVTMTVRLRSRRGRRPTFPGCVPACATRARARAGACVRASFNAALPRE